MHFPQQRIVEWIKHNNWMSFRPEKIADVDIATNERKYILCEVQWQVDEACSRSTVDLHCNKKVLRSTWKTNQQEIRVQQQNSQSGDLEKHMCGP